MRSGPTQDKVPIQSCHDTKAKAGIALLPNTAGLLPGAGEDLHNFGLCFWEVVNHRSKKGRFERVFFAKHLIFLFFHCRRKFPLSKLDHIQIKSDKKPTKPPTLWLRLLFENGDSTSLFDSSSGAMHDRGPVSERSSAPSKFRFCYSGAHC